MHKLPFTFFIILSLGYTFVHGAPAAPSTETTSSDVAQDSSFFTDLYGVYFDGLDSLDSEKDNPAASPSTHAAFVQSKTSLSIASTATSSPTRMIKTQSYPPYTGPGIELAPSSVATESFKHAHPYALGLRKLIAILIVIGVIGLMILCCFLVNERHILFSGRRKNARREREQDNARFRLKHKLLMAERDSGLWTKKPSSECLVSLPSPGDASIDSCEGSDGPDSPSPVQDQQDAEGSPHYPKSKWSMTISDYGISPRTSASTVSRCSLRTSMHVPQQHISISPPQAAFLPGRTLSEYPPVWRYGHIRNQSAPVTPSIASSVSDIAVEGRSRSSSTSSGRVARVRWK